MKKVLIVKTSSLGDILHTLPALTEAKRLLPAVTFDWVVEESFQEIPALHPAVRRVIPVALRRWRKAPFRALIKGEIAAFIKALRLEQYDLMIDAQGLFKSTLLTLLARGSSVGLSPRSARGGIVTLLYGKRVVVPWGEHAVTRVRQLFSQALGYTPQTNSAIDFGLHVTPAISIKPYYVFLHGTTWASKHWPIEYWITLAKMVIQTGYGVQLFFGNTAEYERAMCIKAAVPEVDVAARKYSLTEIAGRLVGSQGVVTVDTGLGHFAGALGVKTIGLFGSTDAKKSGVMGLQVKNKEAVFSCAPCLRRICNYPKKTVIKPPCFETISPESVWKDLQGMA